MRLIDADTLIKDLSYLYTKNHIPVDMRAKEILTTIMEQPTVYDIDSVIEQLKRCYGIVRSSNVDYAEGLKDAYERAIGIVKAGGTCR